MFFKHICLLSYSQPALTSGGFIILDNPVFVNLRNEIWLLRGSELIDKDIIFNWNTTMEKVADLKQKIGSLRISIQNAREKVQEIENILGKEQLPGLELVNKLVETYRDAEKLESDILIGLSGLNENSSIKKGSVPEYIEHLNKYSSGNQVKQWLEALDKFTRVFSDDSVYDELLNDYRKEASRKIEELSPIPEPDGLDKIKEQIDIYLIFVELIETNNSDNALLGIFAEKIGSSKIFWGLTIKKYQIRQSERPKPPEGTEVIVTKHGIKILSNKNIKITPDKLRRHMENISARPALILSCATWLIYFTAEEIIKLLYHFQDEDKQHTDEELNNSINDLVDRGYLISFQLKGQDLTRYVIGTEMKNAFADPAKIKILKSSGKMVPIAMKVFSKSIFDVTKADVISVEERNKAFFDALAYAKKNCDEGAVHDKIIKPLDCRLYCYCINKSGVVLLSRKMLQSLRENNGQNELAQFLLQTRPDLILLLTDIDSDKEARSLIDSYLPERKYLTLPQFFGITEEATPVSDDSPIVKNEGSELGEPTIIEESEPGEPPTMGPDNNFETPEGIAKHIAEIDIQQDEGRFYDLCDTLITILADSPIQKDANEPNRIIQALVFLHALALAKRKDENVKEKYINKSIQFQLATGLKLDDIHFDSQTLGRVFPDNEDVHLKIAAFIRAMFAPDSERDYDLYTLGDQLADQLDNYPHSPKGILKSLFALRSTERGFSPAVLNNFADQTTTQKKGTEISLKAVALKKGPNIKAEIKGIKEFTDICFGKKSEIYEIMEVVEKNDTDMRDIVQSKIEELGDRNSIDEYIDKKWNQVRTTGKGNLPKLKNIAKSQSVGWLEKQKILLEEWLEFSGGDKVKISPETENLRESLLKELPEVIDSIQNGQYDSLVIFNALNHIKAALETGRLPDQTWAFSEFLYSNEVEFTADNNPRFPEFFESLPGMEAWRSVARHIIEPRISLNAVLERIKNREDAYYFDNINHGKKIEDFLILGNQINSDDRIPWDSNENRARENSNTHEEKLFAEMELAYAYGRIEEQEKERLLGLEKKFSLFFNDCRNYGHFRFVLSMFNKLLEKQKSVILGKLRKRFENSLAMPKINKESFLAKEIEKLLQNASFNIAEEHINRLELGEQELPSDQGYEEKDFFDEFHSKWKELHALCYPNRGRAIKIWGPESLLLSDAWTSRQRESSHNLLSNFLPMRKQNTTESNIANFFVEIGFDVENVRRRTIDPYLVFALQVKRPDVDQPDYRHPIAAFGTQIAQPVNVICLFGGYSVTDLIDIIVNQLHLGDNSIVLWDYAETLENRRKLIEDFHNKTSGHNNFLLIDQVLVLYLATLDRSERMPAMLKTTLPFSYCQPFSSGSGTIPDEMFFGRKIELEDILSNTGTNIVYGGRQLGKTALLLRARSIAHKPGNGEYAIYIDIKEKKPDESVGRVYQEMKLAFAEGNANAPVILPKVDNWASLCFGIQNAISGRKIKKLLVLIDEADTFLEHDGMSDFKTIELLINLGRQTTNRFKFVLAGLHNVARSKNAMERNGVFPQMPKPRCIYPLSPMDAANLLKRPLSYLGFKMDHLQQLGLILANTNYYPGILHYFGHILINTVLSVNYKSYYNASTHPPYDLNDDQLRRIFSDNKLNKEIKDKIDITLSLDNRFKILANVIAYQYYLDEDNETDKSKGFTVDEIRKLGLELGIKPEESLTHKNVSDLLSEMADMGILWKNDDESFFRLRRSSFLGTIGTQDKVMENILSLGERGFIP